MIEETLSEEKSKINEVQKDKVLTILGTVTDILNIIFMAP